MAPGRNGRGALPRKDTDAPVPEESPQATSLSCPVTESVAPRFPARQGPDRSPSSGNVLFVPHTGGNRRPYRSLPFPRSRNIRQPRGITEPSRSRTLTALPASLSRCAPRFCSPSRAHGTSLQFTLRSSARFRTLTEHLRRQSGAGKQADPSRTLTAHLNITADAGCSACFFPHSRKRAACRRSPTARPPKIPFRPPPTRTATLPGGALSARLPPPCSVTAGRKAAVYAAKRLRAWARRPD